MRLPRRQGGDDAGERCSYDRVRELARGLVACCHGILVSWMFVDRRIGAAVEVCGNAGKLCVQRSKLLLRPLQRVAGGIEGGLWGKIVGEQLLLALEVDHVEINVL